MRFLTLIVVALAASACSGGSSGSSSSTSAGSSTGAPQICFAGASKSCTGPNDCNGLEICAPDGTSYLPCACPSATGTSTGGTTGGTTGGLTTGGGTGTTSGGTSGTSAGATSSGSTGGPIRIGQACSPSKTCPDTQDCFATNGNNGFCTISCGEGSITPPDAGFDLCAETPALGGTPECGPLFLGNSDGGNTWFCTLLCGNLNGVDEGTCPPSLTCTNHICE